MVSNASNGTYKIDRVEVAYHTGNETVYIYADLVNLGFSKEFEIVGAQAADTTAPELDNFKIIKLVEDDVPSITSGFRWSDYNSNVTTISYSFPWLDTQEAYFSGSYSGNEPHADATFGATNEIAKQFEYALSLYENISKIQFVRVIEDGNKVGDIRFAFSNAVEESWGWAYFPGDYAEAGDIWVNPENFAAPWEPGDFNFEAMLHEIGHALGLDHTFEGDNLLEEIRDNNIYSIMSYTDYAQNIYPVAGYINGNYEFLDYFVSPSTPMVLDILAIQSIYGYNDAFNSGNDTYTLDADDPFFKTIWDGGGIDTIDLSAFEETCQISLIAGSYSNLGFRPPADDGGVQPTYDGSRALSIAYNCDIENVLAGSGSDYLVGNYLDNAMWGNAGDDRFELGSGKNYSGGGDGNDTIILDGNGTFGSDLVALNISLALQTGTAERLNLNGKTRFEDVIDGGADVDTVELTDASDAFFLHDSFSGFHSSLTLSSDYAGKSGTARIENIENINAGDGDDIIDLTSPDYSLAGQTITVDGGEGHDTLWGSDANEILKGGNGDDVLFGGAGTNTLTGGAGADEFQFTRTSIADTVTDYDLTSGDQLKFFYEAGGKEADWSFSILNGDLRWGENTIDFGTVEISALSDLSIFLQEIGSGQAAQFEYMPKLGEEILRVDLYPALYEQDYYNKMVTDLQFAEFDDLAAAIDADMTFLSALNEFAVATGLEADGNGFTYSAGALYNNKYNTVEISADISNFQIDGLEANPISLQPLFEATTIAPGKVGGLFNSITLSANSVVYLTLKHSPDGLSLVYDNATSGMINELRLDGSFENDLDKVIPLVSDLLNFDFSDPIALLGSQEFLDISANLESLATLSGLSILQKGVAEPYLQLTATDTTLNVAYKDWDLVGVIEVSETWQPDPDAALTALQNLVTNSNDLDLSELGSLYEGAGSLSLSILHDDAGKLAEGFIHDFGEFISSSNRDAGDEVIFGIDSGDSYAIESNGLTAVVFKDRDFNETQITELLDELDIRLQGESVSVSGVGTVSALSAYEAEDVGPISLTNAGLQLNDLTADVVIIV